MHLPVTFGVLAVLGLLLIVLRQRWWRLPAGVRAGLVLLAFLSFTLQGLETVTHCSWSSFRLNAGLSWLAIFGYGLLLMRFSLVRPQWVTAVVAVVLSVPVLAASVLLPLTEVFDRLPPATSQIGGGMYSELRRIETSPVAVNGAEFDIYSPVRGARFLRRRRETARLFDTQCDTAVMHAELLPDGRSVRVVCPQWPGEPASSAHSAVVPLR